MRGGADLHDQDCTCTGDDKNSNSEQVGRGGGGGGVAAGRGGTDLHHLECAHEARVSLLGSELEHDRPPVSPNTSV